MENSYNARCPAVKRLLREAKELNEATEEYYAQPLEDNLFEWHFTVRGPPESEFNGGIYHGRIILPADYPMKPPNIIFLTPNGRFEIGKKICLSISGHHPETWQPSWSIRTALLAIIGFMPTPANGTIGGLDYTAAERNHLAKKSQSYKCTECGSISTLLKERTSENEELQKEAREVTTLVSVTPKSDELDNVKAAEEDSLTAKNVFSTDTAAQNAHASVSDQNIADSRPSITSVSLPQQSQSYHYGSYFQNILLCASLFLFVALLLRRLFLLDGEVSEELEDLLV